MLKSSNDRVTFGSLFSGCGLMDAGLERAGLECRWQCEIDADARRVLAKHWPHLSCHEDVCQVGKHNLTPVDVIVGGFPCQDLSVAGQRAGIQGGARSGLWWEMLRVIVELQPRVVLWENVPGLLSSDGGRDLRRVLSSLGEHHYFGCVRTLDARYFGVPQRRRRLFGVFVRGDSTAGRAAQILAVAEGRSRNPPQSREAGQDVAYALAASARGTGDGHGQGWNTTYATADGRSLTGDKSCNQNGKNRKRSNLGDASGADASPTTNAHSGDAPSVAPSTANADSSRKDSKTCNASSAIEVARTLRGRSHRPGVSAPGRGGEDDDNLVCAALNFGNAKGGFRTEPGEHLVVSSLDSSMRFGADDNAAQANHLLAPCLRSNAYNNSDPTMEAQMLVTHSLTSNGADASEDGRGRGTPLTVIPLDMRQASRGATMTNNRGEGVASGGPPGTGIGEEGDPSPSLAGSHVPAVATVSWRGGGMEEGNDVANAIRSGGEGHTGDQMGYVRAGMLVRRLTPTECLRLMGAPDDFLDLDPTLSDSAKYRLCGNGVVVRVATWLGRRIRAHFASAG